MKYKIANYVAKVWFSSVSIAPILLVIISSFKFHKVELDLLFVTIVMGGMFSLPSLILFYFICKYLLKLTEKVKTIKLVLVAVAIVLTYLPFLLLDNFNFLLDNDLLSQPLFLTYSFVLVASVLYYEIELNPVEESTPLNIKQTS